MYKSYVAVAPKPDDFPRLLQAIGDLMRGHYDYSADVKKLTMPTMLVFGDGDMYRPEHIVEFYQLLGGGLRDAGWQRENHVEESPGHPSRPDALRHLLLAETGRHRAALPRRRQRLEDLERG